MSEQKNKALSCDNYENDKQVVTTVGSMRQIEGENGQETGISPAQLIFFDFKRIYKLIEDLESKKQERTAESLPGCVIIHTVEPAKTQDKGYEPGE